MDKSDQTMTRSPVLTQAQQNDILSQEIGVVVEFGEKSSSHKSLDVFMETYGRKVDRAYVIHSKNLRVDGKVVYIPIYMTMFL